MSASCHDCERPYGHEHGFPDLIVPFWVWKQVSPSGDEGGLLCPSCICKRLHAAGITCEGAFMSGPIRSVTPSLMSALRGIENIELALEGRQNKWHALLANHPDTSFPDTYMADGSRWDSTTTPRYRLWWRTVLKHIRSIMRG